MKQPLARDLGLEMCSKDMCVLVGTRAMARNSRYSDLDQ